MSHTPSPSLAAALTDATGDTDPDTLRAATRDLIALQRYARATADTIPPAPADVVDTRLRTRVIEYNRTTAAGVATYRAVWSPTTELWIVFRRRPHATGGRWVIEDFVRTARGAASDASEIVTAQYRDAPPDGRV